MLPFSIEGDDLGNSWLLNSKAIHHLTSDGNQVHNCSSYNGKEGVQIDNGHKLLISSIGHNNLPISNNYFVIKNFDKCISCYNQFFISPSIIC